MQECPPGVRREKVPLEPGCDETEAPESVRGTTQVHNTANVRAEENAAGSGREGCIQSSPCQFPTHVQQHRLVDAGTPPSGVHQSGRARHR